jgi:GAF domain-containing protein/CheY-like chemotaxis protein
MTRVLIVDSDQSTCEMCQAFLGEEDYELHTVCDALEARQFLTTHPCDVILANVARPGLDGAELLRQVREIAHDVPLVTITTNGDSSNGFDDALHDAYDSVVEPITSGRLVRVLDRAAERKRLLDENRRLRMENAARQADLDREVERRTAELEQRGRELSTLMEIVRDICPTLNLTEVLRQITQLSARVCGAHRCTIVLLTADGDMVTPAMSQFGDGHEDRQMWALFQDKSYPVPVSAMPEAEQVILEKRPLFIPDVSVSSLPDHLTMPFGITSVLLVPLISRERAIGLMALDHVEEGHTFTDAQVNLAMSIAAQAAMAIENARLYKETQRRAVQLEAAAEVARNATGILDVDDLLDETVHLISNQFDCYHAAVFLVDEQREYAVLRAASSTAGQRILERRRKLAIEEAGIVGHVTATGEPRIVHDVSEDAAHAYEPDLSDTHAEMALPLRSRGEVIGVLHVQSAQEAAFTKEDGAVLQAMADQLANAIENARLYEAAQRRVAELEAVRQAGLHVTSTLKLQPVLEAILESALQLVSGSDAHVFLYDGQKLSFGAAMWAAKVQRQPYAEPRPHGLTYGVARSGERIVVSSVRDHPLFQDGNWDDWDGAIVGLPLKIGDRVQGVMNVAFGKPHAFHSHELRALELLAAQAAIAIENARLFKETQRHVEELTALHNIDTVITSTLSLDEVLQRVYEQIGKVIDTTTFYIALYDEETAQLRFRFVVDQGEHLAPFTLEVQPNRGFAGWVVHNKKPLWIDDWNREHDSLPVEGIARGTPTRSLMVVPLITKDEVVGVMSSQSYEPQAFDEGHRRLFSDIANQVATAVENARLFEEVNRHLNQTRLLQRIMRETSSTLDFDQVLKRTIEALHETLGIEYLSFSLPDEDGTSLRLHPSQIGYHPSVMAARIPVDRSVGGRVYRTGEPVIVPDTRQTPDYFEVASEVRSELNVPVTVAGRVIAVLNAESPQIDAFHEEDLRLFQAVAAQLGVVLENTRLFEQIRRRLAEVEAVQEVTLAAVSTLDFDQVLERSVRALHRMLDIDFLGFLLPNEEGDSLIPHPPSTGFRDDTLEIPIEGTLAGRAYRTGQVVLVQDVTDATAYSTQSVKVRSALNVPVRSGHRVAAVLRAESPKTEAFGDDEVRLFTTIAGQLGVVLENARLYRRLQEQRDELSQAYEELKEIDRLRTELVQNVSHELRTPFSLVQGYTELLLAGDLGPLLKEQREALRVVRDRAGTLRHLILNLTTLDKLSRGQPQFRAISVVDVTECALEQLVPRAEKAGIRLHKELADQLPQVLGNRDLLVLAFAHLIDNAIKFSPRGSTVTVRAWCDGTHSCVSFTDEGIGIASQHLEHIFKRFYQVDGGMNRRFGGMGIGLALVLEIIEAHRGSVEVESEPSEGSTFTVLLPQAQTEGKAREDDDWGIDDHPREGPRGFLGRSAS